MISLYSVKQRFKVEYPHEDADKAEEDYRKFLNAVSVGEVRPTAEVDKFWHMHLLHTKKYASDCHQLFGRFLHHMPAGDFCVGDQD